MSNERLPHGALHRSAQRAGLPGRSRTRTLLALTALLALGACADMHNVRNHANPGPYGPRAPAETEAAQLRIGIVQAIETVRIPHTGRVGGVHPTAQTSDAYRVTVRMHNGSYQALTQTTGGQLRVGDRVQVVNGVAHLY